MIAGSGGSGLPPGPGLVRGNITALNHASGETIWNLEQLLENGSNKEKLHLMAGSGMVRWFSGSNTGILYIPLGSASPNLQKPRQTPNLYSNHMVAGIS